MHASVILAQVIFMTLLIGMPVVGLLVCRSHKSSHNARIWFLAIALDSLQIPLIALRANYPNWFTTVLPGFIPTIFFIALLVVIQRELNAKYAKSWTLIGLLGSCYLLLQTGVYFASGGSDFQVQTINNLVYLVLSTLLTVQCYKLARKAQSRGMFFVALGFLISILGYLTRAWFHLVEGVPTPLFGFSAISNFQVWTVSLNLILITFGYLGYVLELAEAEKLMLATGTAEALAREKTAAEYNQRLIKVIEERDHMVMVNSRFLNLGALAVFNSAIVHEITQPLQAVLMCLSVLQDKNQEAGGVYADDIAEAIRLTRKSGDIVATLRDMMKHGNDLTEIVSISDEVQKILPVIIGEARQRGIKVRHACQEDIVVEQCNAIMLQRLILNLIVNAFDAFKTSTIAEPEIEIIVCNKKLHGQDMAMIEVGDNGPSMSDEKLQTLFKPFTTNKIDGIGVGLSLAEILLRKWGGRIAANRRPTGGISFTILLPRMTT